MKPTFTKHTFETWWQSINDRAQATKNSHAALLELIAQYRTLSASEREQLDSIFCEWVESGDELRRFDALAMIDEFGITGCIQCLNRYRTRLTSATTPDAPFELAKVARILARLA